VKIAVVIARVLLGLMFFVFGLNGFLHFIPSPPLSGNVSTFMDVLLASHYYVLIFGVQVIAGALLLSNQYVPLALVALAAVLANILTFHITMQPTGLPIALVATVLWFVVALPLRSHFAPLLARKVP
jgi:putative oxidoreductase